MTTVLHDMDESKCPSAQVETGELWLSNDEFTIATGWELKPEGFCKDDICVPANTPGTARLIKDRRVNASGFWRHLGHPVANDQNGHVWAFGASARDRALALQSAEALDFSLPDLNGKTTTLSDLHGKKVVLATWASW